MTNRLLALMLVIGALGYGSLVFLFPQFDAATKWNYQLDREQALLKAKEYASKQGIDLSGWGYGIIPSRDRNLEQYLQDHQASSLETILLSPLKTSIRFRDPRENRTVSFSFAANGQLLSFERTGFKLSEAEKTSPPSKSVAEAAVSELLGDVRPQFAFISESSSEKGKQQFVWSYASPTERELKFDVEATVTGPVLTRLAIKNSLPTAYREELSRRDLASFAVVGGLEFIFTVLCIIGALVLYFYYLNRKELDHLSTLIFFGFTLLLFLVGMGMTTLLNEYKSGGVRVQGINNPTVLLFLPYVLYFLTCFFLTLVLTAFWTTGEVTTAKYQTGKLSVWSAALRGHLFSQSVANNVCVGLLSGGLIAVIPYALAWLGGFTVTPSDLTSRHDILTTTIPTIAAFFNSAIGGELFYLVLLFAFLLPVLRAYFSASWLVNGLFVLVGIISIIDLSPNQTTSIMAKVIVAISWLAIFGIINQFFDLLAVFVANFAAVFVLKMLGLYVQPAASLHTAGTRGLVSLGVMMFVALILTRLAPNTQIEPRRLLTTNEDKAERERLKAEFSVARKAQENLLPASSPQIPGFSIAALCRPARECGGDLYDFIPLKNGRLGIVVADVSGKGVPAALYMTLTKGLLLSISETSSDPGEILREVNKHLYDVCKRKTFVTLFFGVLDPAAKTLTYSRAGHNPPVWRRQSKQTTEWLKPAGIGLGLNSGKSFDRVLKVEQIQLTQNDLLIFYSDGISEAMNEHQEEYGEERLAQVAAITDGMEAEETLSAVFANVSNFLGKVLPQDDQTLVVVRVT
ncbi:MAG: PP2C family protein-serine/threonine phosphatase [Blastocatellia bacterium]|nr:PP2C family protein-serine/threonine phosphatase [Blastocatellia bacterium]